MPNQGLYDLLLRAIEEERGREFADPELAAATPRLDPNFRQLSSAPFVHHADFVSKPLQQPDGEYGAWPGPGNYATPMLAGFRSVITRPRPFPPQSPSASSSADAPPGAAELWKFLEPLWEMYRMTRPSARLGRKRLPDEFDERKDADPTVGPILEWDQKGPQGRGSKAGPDRMQGAPSMVPDADDDASTAAAAAAEAKDFCLQRYLKEEKRCRTKFSKKKYHGCHENAVTRMGQCYANNGRPPVDETEIWDDYE